ncbi:hypothetical protein [Corynebacterium sp.]|uniref:hypothetical protein n=1 Tax=Corynebacterium sp. TaxID=1720 RepID=UPI0028B1A5B8|nr:hypothetical protein [Corynebacterium sp.]
MDFENHALHRTWVAKTQGRYWGIADSDGNPLMDLPPALPGFEVPRTLNATSSAQASFIIRSRRGHLHPVVATLVDEKLGAADSDGRLEPALKGTFFLVHQVGEYRQTFLIGSVALSGPSDGPNTMEIRAANMTTLIDGIPLWSYPRSLRGRWRTVDQDFAGPWTKSYELQNVFFGAQADGFTVTGPAEETIRTLMDETLAATWRAIDYQGDPPVVVDPTPSGRQSPNIMIRPDDGFLWQTLAPIAAMSGVSIDSFMWWPGDSPVEGHQLTQPTVVITVEQRTEE